MSALSRSERLKNLLFSWPDKAVELFYEWYFDRLVSVSLKYTCDEKASEDIVQETFFNVWQKHKELAQNEKLSVYRYLYGIVRHKSIDAYWRNIEVGELQAAYLEDTDTTSLSAELRIIVGEKREHLRGIIATFPRMEKECLLMQLDGIPVAEIARHFGVTVKAIERSLTCAKKRLRQYKASLE